MEKKGHLEEKGWGGWRHGRGKQETRRGRHLASERRWKESVLEWGWRLCWWEVGEKGVSGRLWEKRNRWEKRNKWEKWEKKRWSGGWEVTHEQFESHSLHPPHSAFPLFFLLH